MFRLQVESANLILPYMGSSTSLGALHPLQHLTKQLLALELEAIENLLCRTDRNLIFATRQTFPGLWHSACARIQWKGNLQPR